MLVAYGILALTLISATVVATYVLLNAENPYWMWTSFLAAASTSFYVFLYSVYYFHFKTSMYGLMQVSFYFGYTFMFVFAIFLFAGALGFFGSLLFVKTIYSNIKTD